MTTDNDHPHFRREAPPMSGEPTFTVHDGRRLFATREGVLDIERMELMMDAKWKLHLAEDAHADALRNWLAEWDTVDDARYVALSDAVTHARSALDAAAAEYAECVAKVARLEQEA